MFLFCASALASEPYWRLRDRLVEDFLVVDDAAGGMVPATRRVDSTGSMKWADATLQLGWWMGALAIEQALLSQPKVLPSFVAEGRTADAAAADLALTLTALDRLDNHPAAAFPDCAGPWGLDGFFVRDDVPAEYTAHFPGISVIESDWIDPEGSNKEMSQDQVIHVLVGLALVAHYTDPALTVDGVVLREQAIAATERIAALVVADGAWVIRNPGCEDRDVARGEMAQFYSEAFADTFRAITGETPAEGLFPDAWDDAADPDYVAYSNHNNQHMAMALAATGDAWNETTAADLWTLADAPGWYAYPALHAALWGAPDDGGTLEAALAAQLEELGSGEPMSPWPATSASSWSTWHRYVASPDEVWTGENDSAGWRYPGVDYLLAHNLHAATFLAEWPEEKAEADADEDAACGCAATPPVGALSLLAAWALRRRPTSSGGSTSGGWCSRRRPS